jgi:hypothetical protein
MDKLLKTACAAALLLAAAGLQAEPAKDCLLEGTVHRSTSGGEDSLQVKFHSMKQYEPGARCRNRRNEKVEFKLPDDPRLQDAPDGSAVKFRYREERNGESRTDLISVGTST